MTRRSLLTSEGVPLPMQRYYTRQGMLALLERMADSPARFCVFRSDAGVEVLEIDGPVRTAEDFLRAVGAVDDARTLGPSPWPLIPTGQERDG